MYSCLPLQGQMPPRASPGDQEFADTSPRLNDCQIFARNFFIEFLYTDDTVKEKCVYQVTVP